MTPFQIRSIGDALLIEITGPATPDELNSIRNTMSPTDQERLVGWRVVSRL